MRMNGVARMMVLWAITGAVFAGDVFRESPSNPAKEYGEFHIGVTGISASIKKGLVVTVEAAAPNTPAAGKFRKGDILVAVNGRAISDPEPWVALGEALGAAEAADGRMVFGITRDGKDEHVAIQIPALGAYSKTWPSECEKSDTIIRQTAERIMLKGRKLGTGLTDSLAGLFLLSTGDDQYLPTVKAMAMRHSATKSGSHTWNNGYAGILLGEYYLRTGDKAALPRLKAICDDSARRQFSGGWSHWGEGTNGGYVCGGLMNPAGVQILTTMILARECGITVNALAFDRALRFFYRFAGHAAVPYGDHRPEIWLSCNGKNGMLACALSLLENDACQLAAQHMAMDMADSYRWLLSGHTGGGFDVIWRGLSTVHVPPDKQSHYRRSMDRLAWYYDLSRLPKGGFSMVGGGRQYSGERWGNGGMGLAYTAPRRTLRITGGPPTEYSHKFVLPDSPWGNPQDLVFFSNKHAKGFGEDDLQPHEVYRILDAKSSREATVEKAFCVKMLRHYQSTARTRAALALARMGAIDELAEALVDADPRVRRAACDGIDLYQGWSRSAEGAFPPQVVSERFLKGIEAIVNDPDAAWWELDGALLALGRAAPVDIRRNITGIKRNLGHEEWFLREGAALCLAALAQDSALFAEQRTLLIDYLAEERHLFPRRAVLSFLRKYQTNKKVGGEVKQDIISALMTATLQMPLISGHLSGMTFNNRYEMMRFFYAQAPELSIQVIDEAERMLASPDGVASCNIQWYLTGERWGNPGVLKSLAKLPVEERAPLLARCKQFAKKLKEKRDEMKAKRDDTKRIDRFVIEVDKAIADYEASRQAPATVKGQSGKRKK